ncbi:MAG: ABC transporter permease [Vicinamibacterales bacterium]
MRSAAEGARHAGRWLAMEAASLVVAHAIARLGGVARSIRGWRVEGRLAWRAIGRRPWQTAATAAILGAGLAGVVTVASLATYLLQTPVAAQGDERVWRVTSVGQSSLDPRLQFSFAELEVLTRHAAKGDRIVAANLQPAVLRVGNTRLQGLGEVVTSGFFAVTGQDVLVGRHLMEADFNAAAPPAAVISEELWRSQFGRSVSVIGTTLDVNRVAFTIVGVVEGRAALGFGGVAVDVWIAQPHADAMLNPGWRTDPADRWWAPLVESAAGQGAVGTALARAHADLLPLSPDEWRTRRLRIEPALMLAGTQRRAAVALMALLGSLAMLMLIVSGASASGLVLAAASAERHHLSIHLALGAGHGSLIRRRVMEGAVIGLAAGALAVAAYAWARTALATVALQPALVLRLKLPLDPALVSMVIAFGGTVGMLVALGPAWWSVSGGRLDTVGSAPTRVYSTLPLARRALVGIQVALSVTLVVGASVAAQSLGRLSAMDAGFDRAGLVAMDFDVEPVTSGPREAAALARQAVERIRRLPGIVSAAMANRAPVDPSTPAVEVRRPDQAAAAVAATHSAVTDGYFALTGIPMLAGRDFRLEEVGNESGVVIINQTLAHRLWPDGDALGRALVIDRPQRTARVVGIARDARARSLAEPGRAQLYTPVSPGFSLALLARTNGDPRDALRAMQAALDEVGPGVVGFFPRTMDEHLSAELLPSRAATRMAALLGLLAIGLSVAGLYGLSTWFVDVRRREIGVRLALGAAPRDVRRMVVRQAVAATAPGAIGGVLAGAALTMAARSVLPEVAPVEPLALAAGLVSVVAVVAAASYVPCRRAAGVTPVDSLRA